MKKIKSLVVASALVFSGVSVAEMCDVTPFVGLGYQYGSMKAKNDWAKVANKKQDGALAFVGAKFHENFGAELGWEQSSSKNRQTTAVGTFDGVATNNGTQKVKTKVSGGYVDLQGYLPVVDNFEVLGSLGMGSVVAKINSTVDVLSSVAHKNKLNQKSKRSLVGRVGVGAKYMFTDMFGVRVMAKWENTSRIKLKNKDTVITDSKLLKPFKDNVSANVAALVQF